MLYSNRQTTFSISTLVSYDFQVHILLGKFTLDDSFYLSMERKLT